MPEKLNKLSLSYARELKVYVAKGPQADQQPALELGQGIIALGLDSLHLAKIHESALKQLVEPGDTPKITARKARLAGKFLIRALTPIEELHRVALNEHAKFIQRGAQLIESNLKLKREVERRTIAEKSLKEKVAQSLQMQKHLKQISHDLINAQEDERRTISRELHDDIAQTLAGINVHLAKLKMDSSLNTLDLTKKIAHTQSIVKKSVEIVHQFARKLRPTMLDDLGLIPALTTMVNEFSKRTGIAIKLAAFAGIENMTSAKRTIVYRVIQAALSNIDRHAEAKKVKVSLKMAQNDVQLTVSDDGKSFPVEKTLHSRNNKRLGLIGMRERVEMVGGSFSVVSEAGVGTTISAIFPFGKILKVQS